MKNMNILLAVSITNMEGPKIGLMTLYLNVNTTVNFSYKVPLIRTDKQQLAFPLTTHHLHET